VSEPRLLSIGDFAGICQLSVKTLRHYHSIGLLVPACVDERTGYRSYRFDQVAVALDIAALRGLGLSLPDIGSALADGGARRGEVLAEHRDRLRRDLDTTADRLAHLERILDREQPPPMTYDITEQSIPAQRVASKLISGPNGPDTNQRAMIAGFADLVAALEAGGATEADVVGPPVVVVHHGDEERFDQEVCLPIADHVVPVSAQVTVRELEPVRAAVARHVGDRPDVQAVMAWASERGHEVRLPFRVVIVAAPPTFGEGDEHLSDIVVPFHELASSTPTPSRR
jgi:DNA-binding transcriptional MerR regulator